MQVDEIMTESLFTVPVELRVSEGLQLARAAGVDHLLLTERRRLVGVACVCDLEVHDQTEKLETTVPSRLVTVEAESPLSAAAKLFLDKNVGCLPVLHGIELVGVLTRSDLARGDLEEDTLPVALRCSYCGETHHVRELRGKPGMAACLDCQRRSDAAGEYEEGTKD